MAGLGFAVFPPWPFAAPFPRLLILESCGGEAASVEEKWLLRFAIQAGNILEPPVEEQVASPSIGDGKKDVGRSLWSLGTAGSASS